MKILKKLFLEKFYKFIEDFKITKRSNIRENFYCIKLIKKLYLVK